VLKFVGLPLGPGRQIPRSPRAEQSSLPPSRAEARRLQYFPIRFNFTLRNMNVHVGGEGPAVNAGAICWSKLQRIRYDVAKKHTGLYGKLVIF
jgi:hypothetical protein